MARKRRSECTGCDDYVQKESNGGKMACKHTDGCKTHTSNREKDGEN